MLYHLWKQFGSFLIKINQKHSIYGGVKRGESPEMALRREMTEELGIEWNRYQFWRRYSMRPMATPVTESLEMSSSYPGLPAFYRRHFFDIFLKPHQFNPEGYVERQANKDIYFDWMNLSDYQKLTFKRD